MTVITKRTPSLLEGFSESLGYIWTRKGQQLELSAETRTDEVFSPVDVTGGILLILQSELWLFNF